mgnify:CR=1 FL=1|jgi:hypothetical protein
MFNFIKKNITKLRHTSKIQQTRDMPTTPTRDIDRPAAELAQALGLQKHVSKGPNSTSGNIGTGRATNQKIRLRGLWRFYLSKIKPGLSSKKNITQIINLVKYLRCGGNGNCTRRIVDDKPDSPLRYPHMNINYIPQPPC